jgi:hypothetical protein
MGSTPWLPKRRHACRAAGAGSGPHGDGWAVRIDSTLVRD